MGRNMENVPHLANSILLEENDHRRGHFLYLEATKPREKHDWKMTSLLG